MSASTYSFGWIVHKDLDLILTLFHAGLPGGAQRGRMCRIPDNRNMTVFPEAVVFQPLVKAKNSV